MFAIISFDGNQYKVYENKQVKIAFQDLKENEKMNFSDVLLISDGKKVKIGEPLVKGASVEGSVVSTVVDDKVEVFKFHSKKRYKRTGGHRQKYTTVLISKINS